MNKNFKDNLISLCGEILEIGMKIDTGKAREKDLDKPFDKLKKLLEHRFNIKYEIETGILLATYPPMTSMGSAIDNIDYKEIIQMFEIKELEHLLTSNDKVLKDDNGFYIDYKNKEIIYKGKNKFNAVLFISPVDLVRCGINADELAAALLHEIGHDFEYLRFKEYFTKKAEHLIDDIRKALKSDNALDKITEVVIKESKEKIEIDELSTIDKLTIIINAPNTIYDISQQEYFTRYKLSDPAAIGKENETEADRFVTDFGLAHFLPSGLNKLHVFYNTSKIFYNRAITPLIEPYVVKAVMNNPGKEIFVMLSIAIGLLLFYKFIYLPIFEKMFGKVDTKSQEFLYKMLIMYSKLILISNYLLMLNNVLNLTLCPLTTQTLINGVIGIFINYYNNYREEGGSSVFIYESDVNRIDSIKRNLISKLKEVDNLQVKKEILKQIEYVDKELEKAKKLFGDLDTEPAGPNLVPTIMMFKDMNILNPIYVLNKIIRNHVNNDLYVTSVKLELDSRGWASTICIYIFFLSYIIKI